jgi:hypothetical protein
MPIAISVNLLRFESYQRQSILDTKSESPSPTLDEADIASVVIDVRFRG